MTQAKSQSAIDVESLHALIERREKGFLADKPRRRLMRDLEVLLHARGRLRPRSIAIVAESNGGKTALVKHFIRNHPRSSTPASQVIPAIYINMTMIPRVEDLSIALLTAIGATSALGMKHADRMAAFIELAHKVNLGIVFLDEFHDCADTTGRGKPFLRAIKGLLQNDVIVVPMGTEELEAVLRMDLQLASRFNFSKGRLPRIRDMATTLALMLKVMGVGVERADQANRPSDECVDFVLKESRGTIGHMLDLVEETLEQHGAINIANLREVRSRLDVLDGLA